MIAPNDNLHTHTVKESGKEQLENPRTYTISLKATEETEERYDKQKSGRIYAYFWARRVDVTT